MPVFSPGTTDFISELDTAVAAHMDWTRRVLRCAITGESPGNDALAPRAHTLCRFGRWFANVEAQFEALDADGTRKLGAAHEAMHDAVRSMCGDLLAGRAVSTDQLARFEQTQKDVIALMAGFKSGFLATAARHDPLTGLPLRYGIETEFKLMQQLSKRVHSAFYLMMIDIDRFKRINDTYGHPVGDTALLHVVQVLKRVKRNNEPLYRFGGEEFVLLLQNPPADDLTQAAQRFLDAVRDAPLQVSPDIIVRITVTIGMTRVAPDEDMGKAIERADNALLQGKNAGRDRCVFAADPPEVEA